MYAYKTLLFHLPGIACFYISDYFWSYLNSQKIFRPVNYIFFIGLILHILLSITISKAYGFYGIVVSTNIMFLSIFSMTLYLACTKV
jgi:O-antigen/teichoic acid export membrane protein